MITESMTSKNTVQYTFYNETNAFMLCYEISETVGLGRFLVFRPSFLKEQKNSVCRHFKNKVPFLLGMHSAHLRIVQESLAS